MQITKDGTLVVGLRSIPQMALVDTETLAVRHVTFQGFGISGHQWLRRTGATRSSRSRARSTIRPGAIGQVDNRSGAVVKTWEYPYGPLPHGVFFDRKVLR